MSANAADAAIEHFLDALWLEKGLSANTLLAYRHDLGAFAGWLAARGSTLAGAMRCTSLT